VLGLLVAAVYGRALWWMVVEGWQNEYYEHAAFLPVISAILLFRKRREFVAAPCSMDARGLAVVIGALALHLAAVAVDVHFPSIVSFVLLLIGLVWWLYGEARLRVVLFPVAFLFFMVPLARVLVEYVGGPSQLVAASLSATFARLLGLPVALAGTTVRLPCYQFDVGVPCSGLKALVTLTALAALYAYAIEGRLWQRGLLLAAAVPIAIVANAGRVAIVLLLGQGFSPELADGFFHGASGLVVFLIAVAALIGVGWALGCRQIRDDL
jgi:exosortase